MAQLNIRLEDHAREALDALARARGVRASDLVRSLIDAALGREDPDRPYGDLTPTSLPVAERAALALQHRVLGLLAAQAGEGGERLADGDAAHHARLVEVLERGYTAEYPSLFAGIEAEMSRRECALVHDILEMFTFLEHSWRQLTDTDRATLLTEHEYAEHTLTFAGFDFNDALESRLAGYARHLVNTDRWPALAARFDDAHERGNSHSPRLASYQHLLNTWRPIWAQKRIGGLARGPRGYDLTVDELRRILQT